MSAQELKREHFKALELLSQTVKKCSTQLNRKNDQEEYLIALDISKQLLEEKENHIYKTEKKAKRLMKKRINNNNK